MIHMIFTSDNRDTTLDFNECGDGCYIFADENGQRATIWLGSRKAEWLHEALGKFLACQQAIKRAEATEDQPTDVEGVSKR